MSNIATFRPVTVTAETLGVLSKQPNYPELLALYMAYIEIIAWQGTIQVRATTNFMKVRLGWGELKFKRAKNGLLALGLISDYQKKDKQGKIVGHYIAVNYVVNPPYGKTQRVDNQTPNALELKGSALKNKDSKESSVDKGSKKEQEDFIQELHLLLEGKRPLKALDDYRKQLQARLKTFSYEEIREATRNLSYDDYNMGREDRNPNKYATVEYILRDNKKIEKYLQSEGGSAPDPENRGRLKIDKESINWDEV